MIGNRNYLWCGSLLKWQGISKRCTKMKEVSQAMELQIFRIRQSKKISIVSEMSSSCSNENMCRNRLVSVFQQFPEYFDIDMSIVLEKEPLRWLANIFFTFIQVCNEATTIIDDSAKTARRGAKLASTSMKRCCFFKYYQ